jgi:hypothetical protein
VSGNANALNKWLNTDQFSLTSSHYNDSGCSQFGKDTFYAYTFGHNEKITNGTFNSVFTPWVGQSRNSSSTVIGPDVNVLTISAGTLAITNYANFAVGSAVQQISGLTIGATYKVSASITTASAGNPARVAVTTDSQGLGTDFGASGVSLYNSGSFTSPGSVDGSFVATATFHYISLQNFTFTQSGAVGFDNVSVIGP